MNDQPKRAHDCSQAPWPSSLREGSLFLVKDKDNASNNQSKTQLDRVYYAFKNSRTMLEVSNHKGILRCNIFRCISSYEKQGMIKCIRICPISKHRAGIYTTNETLLVSDADQLKQFLL